MTKMPNRVRSTTEIVGFFVSHLKPAGAPRAVN